MPDTFVSYRREDSAGYAGRLREALERRLGHARIFRDVDTLQPGQDFVRAIDERVRECRVFLALIGREWLDARDAAGHRRIHQEEDHVRLEIATALGRGDLLVVPVLVEGASMPASRDLPASIRGLAFRHAISLRDETWDIDVDRLAVVIGGRPGDHATHAGAAVGSTVSDAWRGSHTREGRRTFPASAALGLIAVALLLLVVGREWSTRPPSPANNRDHPSEVHGAPVSPAMPEKPAATTGSPAAPAARGATTGGRDAAELHRVEAEVDRLHTRFVAVDQSLSTLREQQARAGLALRRDMAARHQAARTHIDRAREAISAGDLAGARRFTALAAADVEAVERFLAR